MENQDFIYLKKQRYDFTIIDNDILRDERVKHARTLLVYWILNFHTDRQGVECKISLEKIAKRARISKTTVIQGVNELVELGFIKKEKRQREQKDFFYNQYTILAKFKNIKT